ncbi:hypothetical protein D0Z07_6953 [Hyphodiscus hymeniophilus]|uniref:Uncharacterized protein n=1 Tax=Hyphodiscus hymeniophilus TaxID=353542 RepID=A0A9P6VFP7_9HELO|nr:hypothetical protein D0Z07_6953 [Hyphodiscus hymeniophilus]
MRPTTPQFNFAHQAGPSSPPATPTSTTFNFTGKKSRRQGIADFRNFPPIAPTIDTNGSTITPNGSGMTFSYNRFEPLDHSPRSSSPASSHHLSDSNRDSAHAQSRSSSPVEAVSESPLKKARMKITAEGNFTVEEFRESDYEGFDSDCESVLRPHQYEDAESEKARSTRAPSPRHELDDKVVNGLRDLDCGTEELDAEEEHQAWLERKRQANRRKRRSSGSVQKRSLAQSIGSDTDDEDLKPVSFEGANEAGSSARRLRRKVAGERTSLIFDDPPVGRIEEVEEPDSCEEGVAVGEVEELTDEDRWDREMPFYGQEDMDVDSDSGTDSDEEE